MEVNPLMESCAITHSTARRSAFLHGVCAGAAASHFSCLGPPGWPTREFRCDDQGCVLLSNAQKQHF